MQMQSARWYLGTVVYGDTQVSSKTPVTRQNVGCYSHNFYPVDPWMMHGWFFVDERKRAMKEERDWQGICRKYMNDIIKIQVTKSDTGGKD